MPSPSPQWDVTAGIPHKNDLDAVVIDLSSGCVQGQTHCVRRCFDTKTRSWADEGVRDGVGVTDGEGLEDPEDRGDVEGNRTVYTPCAQLVHAFGRRNAYAMHRRTLGVALRRRCTRGCNARA